MESTLSVIVDYSNTAGGLADNSGWSIPSSIVEDELGDLEFDTQVKTSAEEPFVCIESPNGTVVNVFENCVDGNCKCVYTLEGRKLQLKPCRFASIICNELNVWASNRLSLLWAVTDGFPIAQGEVPSYACANYSSILLPESKQCMDDIIRKELAEGMISIVDFSPHCIHSLGAVPKPGGKIRPITDCSRPTGLSINNFCGSLLKEFKFKSVDDVIAMLNPGEFMTVIDIKSAYRAVPISGEHRKYMGFTWELGGTEYTFVDNRLCFGLRLGPSYFEEISDFLYDVLVNCYNMRIVNYLDDFIAIADTYENCIVEQGRIIELLRFVGFHVSYEKVKPPSTCTTYLGIEIDSISMELRLPQQKLEKLKNLLSKYLTVRKISKLDLESLGGLLSHCAHVVRGGKIFCKRIYSLYKEMLNKGKKFIRIPSEARSDIKWWHSFCGIFNGVAKINNSLHEQPMVSDSSFKGFAVYLGRDWLAGSWEQGMLDISVTNCGHLVNEPPAELGGTDPNINVFELWPIVMGIKRWANKLRDMSVLVFTDNTQVLYMLLNGKSSNKNCMSWLREIFWICMIYNIEILPRYINTSNNLVADTLSRLLYFNSGEEIANKIRGADLCCLDLLFANYRSDRDGTGGKGSGVP